MADKLVSTLTQECDCKWVRALDANGNSIRISKEDLAAVVGGLLPTASQEQNGLLEKSMYTILEKKTTATNYAMYEITSNVNNWSRDFSIIKGGFEGDPVFIIVSVLLKDSASNDKIIVTSLSPKIETPNYIKFIKKDRKVYVLFNISANSPNSILIQSSKDFRMVSQGKYPDDSYVELDISYK